MGQKKIIRGGKVFHKIIHLRESGAGKFFRLEHPEINYQHGGEYSGESHRNIPDVFRRKIPYQHN